MTASQRPDDTINFQEALYEGGNLLGLTRFPKVGENPSLDMNNPVFTNYVNPILDKAGTQGKINVLIVITPDLRVELKVSGDSTAKIIQQGLKPLADKMTKILLLAKESGKVENPDSPKTLGWLLNYG